MEIFNPPDTWQEWPDRYQTHTCQCEHDRCSKHFTMNNVTQFDFIHLVQDEGWHVHLDGNELRYYCPWHAKDQFS